MPKPENYHDLQIRLINENKKINKWIVYLKAYSQYYKISYKQAMTQAGKYYYQQNKIFSVILEKDEKDDLKNNNILEYNKMTTTVKTPNPWVSFVKKYAKDNNLSYACAVSNPECSLLYKQSKEILKPPKKYNITVKGMEPKQYMKSVKHKKKQKEAQNFLSNLGTKAKQYIPEPPVPPPKPKSKLNIIEINEMLTDYMQLSKNIKTRDDLNKFNKLYKKLSLKLHPDKLVNEPADIRTKLMKTIQQINHGKDMINEMYENIE
jgi:hypothetical protein